MMMHEGKPRDADEKGLARTKLEEHAIIASVRRSPERRRIRTSNRKMQGNPVRMIQKRKDSIIDDVRGATSR